MAIRSYGELGFDASSTDGSLQAVYRVGWNAGDLEFGRVSVGSLLRDNRALVYDSQLRELFVLGEGGRVEHRFGRQGDGPGEYQSVSAVHMLPGDSILVYDGANYRVSVLSPDFEFVRSFPSTMGLVPADVMWLHRPTGATSSGQVVWTPEAYSIRRHESGLHWVETPIYVGPPREDAADSVMALPFVEIRAEAGRVVSNRFRRTGWTSGHPDGLVWARNDRAEVRWYSEEGDLLRVTRWAQTPVDVTDSVWAKYVEAYVLELGASSHTGDEAGLRARLDEDRSRAMPTLPMFGTLLAGLDGSVWLSEYTFPGRESGPLIALDPAGEWMGTYATPPSLQLLDATVDVVLGVETNALDIPAVTLYRVER